MNSTSDKTTEIYKRNIPSQPLQIYYDPIPVPSNIPATSYKQPSIPTIQQPMYNYRQTFNPGSSMGPWSGFASNINTESDLRNQFYSLSKATQAFYIPNSNSDLYKETIDQYSPPPPQHSILFTKEQFLPFNPTPNNVGSSLFNNPTREQLR